MSLSTLSFNRLIRLASNSAFIAGQRLANGLFQFVFFLFLINILSTDALGIFELGRACLEIGTGIVVPGLTLIVMRENSRRRTWWNNNGAAVIRLLQWVALIVAPIILIIANLQSFNWQPFFVILLFCITIYFQSLCTLFESLFISLNKIEWSMSVNVACNLVAVTLGILLVQFTPFPLFGAAIAIMARWIMNYLIFDARTKKSFPGFRFAESSRASSVFELMRDYWLLTLGSVFFIIYARIDTIMLEWMGSTTSIALYSAAYRFIGLLSMIFLSVYQAVTPTISRRLKQSQKHAYHLVFIIGSLLGLLGLGLAFLLQFRGEEITTFLYPDMYEKSIYGLKILSWTLPIIFMGNAFGYYLVNEKKNGVKAYAVINLLGLIINLTGNAILIPYYDFVGAAWMTVVTDGITTLLMIIIAAIIAYRGHIPKEETQNHFND